MLKRCLKKITECVRNTFNKVLIIEINSCIPVKNKTLPTDFFGVLTRQWEDNLVPLYHGKCIDL